MKEYIARRISAVHVIDATGNEVPSDLLDSLGISLITNEAVQPPTLGPAIADRTYVVGAAPVTIDLSQRFLGAISYGMTPTNIPGVTRSGAIVTIDPATTRPTTAITVTGTNTAGTASMTFNLTVNAVSPTSTAALPDRSLTVGDAAVVLALGDFFANAASYAVSPTGQGVSISGSTMTISAAAERNATYTVTASNSTGQTVSAAFALVVAPVPAPAPSLESVAYVWIDRNTPYTGTPTEVTAVQTEGTGGVVLSQVSTGNAVQHVDGEEGGFSFSVGRRLINSAIAPATSDGFIILVDVTPGAATGTQQYATYGNQVGVLRSATAAYQAVAANTGFPVSAGTVTVGTRAIFAMEIDRVGGVRRVRNTNGTIVTDAATNAAFSITSLTVGQGVLGTIHRLAIVNRPAGQQLPISFADALAEFAVVPPPPVTARVAIHDADGQSEYLGPNASNLVAPSGQQWKDAIQGPSVETLVGLLRSDGRAITAVSNPLLFGYDLTSVAIGTQEALIAGNVPVGIIAARAMKRDQTVTDTLAFQFHGAGGQQVYNFDNDPLTGTADLVTLYKNQEHWLTQAVSYYESLGSTVEVPRRYWCQGGSDEQLARGLYQARFSEVHQERINLIREATGQTYDPRLYIWQTGAVMLKQYAQNFRFDILDIVREWDAVLVAPLYPIMVADGFVHPGIEETVYMGEMDAWATAEVLAGNGWSLMPPISVTRAGDTITIPISVRNDETLTTTPGKYAAYGGDPANLGLTAIGGGSITSASVNGGNIVINVSGAVTAIEYANAPVGSDLRTAVDGAGKGYSVNRGLIRTTLTKVQESFGGISMTLERWLPSFSVAIT
ncbi:hypothetical protein CP157_01154 [Paracoccus marcusii]|uniref:hypothetical protein n=1 Tax=Paracoccus marcusii TaxID=59779 RepID=UPI001C3D0C3A|nr:hypothetical protein [Paracoccus marcusii]QXI63436.1 hypothetical protein CP157_01154 [Paracoccus marcusii]